MRGPPMPTGGARIIWLLMIVGVVMFAFAGGLEALTSTATVKVNATQTAALNVTINPTQDCYNVKNPGYPAGGAPTQVCNNAPALGRGVMSITQVFVAAAVCGLFIFGLNGPGRRFFSH